MSTCRPGSDHAEQRRADRQAKRLAESRSACSGYLRRNPSLIVGLCPALGAAAVRRHRPLHRSTPSKRPPAVGPAAAAAVAGTALRQRQAGPQPLRGDGRGHAADAAHRPDRRVHRRRHRRHPGVHRRRYYGGWSTPSSAVIVDIGLTVPGLMVLIIIAMRVRGGLTVDQMALVIASLAWLYPGADDPLPGADHARAQLRADRAPVGDERPGDHRQGVAAQPAAVPRGVAGRRRLGGDPGLDRPGGARARLPSTRRRSA